MAQGDVYFKGGPCDGTTRALTLAEADTGEAVCKGGLYKNPYTGAHHDGSIVFDYAGKAGPPPSNGGTPHTHKGWTHLQHSVNVNLPQALDRADAKTRAALRSLGRGRKVRL